VWTPGQAVNNPAPQVDPQSVLDYCYASTPTSLGLTGARAFTGSGTGAIYVNPAGVQIPCNPIPPATAFLE
jgi:hypothetical protein